MEILLEQAILKSIEENNKKIDYLKVNGRNLSNKELLELRNIIESELREQLKTILLLMGNNSTLKN